VQCSGHSEPQAPKRRPARLHSIAGVNGNGKPERQTNDNRQAIYGLEHFLLHFKFDDTLI